MLIEVGVTSVAAIETAGMVVGTVDDCTSKEVE